MPKHKFSWPFRMVSLALAGIQVVTPMLPTALLTLTNTPAYADTSSQTGSNQPRQIIRRPSFLEPVAVLPHFSSPPTAAEFFSVHLFSVPLVPIGNPTSEENTALAQALELYMARNRVEDQSAILDFLQQHPQSAWKPALLINLGIIWRETGYFTRARDAWAEAWNLSKHATDTRQRALADRALAELAQVYAWVGSYDELQPLFKEIGNRKLLGGSEEMLVDARDGLAVMNNSPQGGFLCGPFALQEILAQSTPGAHSSVLINAKSTRQGISLAQLQEFADQAGMNMQMAKRSQGSDFVIGSVVHWKLNHYGALLDEKNGRYLIGDSTFSRIYGKSLWISKTALEEESDGYFLIPKGNLSAGWRKVTEDEGKNVWGKGTTIARDTDFHQKTCPCHTQDLSAGSPDDNNQPSTPTSGEQSATVYNERTNSLDNYGMAGYQIAILDASLYLTDTPLQYHPPVGPDVKFKLTYNYRDPYLQFLANYSNLGAQWSFGWFTYINDDGSGTVNSTVTRYDNSEGLISYSISNATAGIYFPDRFGNILQYDSTSHVYTLTFPDGSQQIFGKNIPLAPYAVTRMVFLTSQIDSAQNSLTFSYDTMGRLSQVNDAVGTPGQTTTLFYDLPEDPYKITRVEDPFGRFTYFQYDEQGRLQKITDEIGMSSAFTYDSGDFITELTTPYGVTSFSYGDGGTASSARWLYVTDPNGDHEYVYSPDTTSTDADAISSGDTSDGAPAFPSSSHSFSNGALDYRNAFYFDKSALAIGTTNDFANATVYHWLHDNESSGSPLESGILESIRPPFESRIYFWYPGQTSAGFSAGITLRDPCVIARIVDDSTNAGITLTQASQYTYNDQGRLTLYTDPAGRTTKYNYYPNGVDLQSIQQTNGTGVDLLAGYGTYNSQHCPSSYTNAAGMVYNYTWNSSGQLTQVTDPNSDLENYNYLTDNYLGSIIRAGGGLSATNSFGYDFYGRLSAITNAEGYFITVNYDNLNRPIKITCPDGTFESYVYDKLNLLAEYDRAGNRTAWSYDGTGRTTSMRDRLNRRTQYSWCGCGGIASITDPNGNTTSWSHDAEGRVTEKIYPDTTSLNYAYESRTRRLRSITDAESQSKYYFYNVDNTLASIAYSNSIVQTPSISFGYDTNYDRLTMMSDGVGMTLYNYYPVTGSVNLGAGHLETVSNLFANATITYKYDDLGRVTNRAIDSVNESVAFDDLGRVTNDSSVLGNIGYYYGSDNRLNEKTFPNAIVSSYIYYPQNYQDGRLATNEIQNFGIDPHVWQPTYELANGENDYNYDVLGRVVGKRSSVNEVVYSNPFAGYLAYDAITDGSGFSYDFDGQLLNSIKTNSSLGYLNTYSYSYDSGGNRTGAQQETDGSSVFTGESHYNSLNQKTNCAGAGLLPVGFMGTFNQPAMVAVVANTNSVTGTTWSPTTIQSAGIISQTFTATLNIPAGYYGVPSGSSTSIPYTPPISIVAQSGAYWTSNTYNLNVVGVSNVVSKYDLDGNCTNVSTPGTNIVYIWDAENRLASISKYVTNSATLYTTKFYYDGFSRWCQIVEMSNSVIESTQRFVWCGLRKCEERSGSDVVTKRFFEQGEQISGNSYYYIRDQSGSVQTMVDANNMIRADYDYDPYGNQTQIQGDLSSDFGFDGYYSHTPSGLSLTVYRAYDPVSGRWLNRDPIGENGGLNLYGYVGNDPINFKDPTGHFSLIALLGVAAFITIVSVAVLDYEESKRDYQQGEADAAYRDNKFLTDPMHADPNPASPSGITKDCYQFGLDGVKDAHDTPLTTMNPPLSPDEYPEISGLPEDASKNVDTASKLTDAGQNLGEQAADQSDANNDTNSDNK